MDDFGLSFPAQINIRPLVPFGKDTQNNRERTQEPKGPAQSISRGQYNYQEAPRRPSRSSFEHGTARRKQRAPYPRSVTSITDAPSSHHTYKPPEPREYNWRRNPDSHSHLANLEPNTPPTSTSSRSPAPESLRYEIIKRLNNDRHTNSGTYLIQDRQTKTLFIEKRLQTSTPTSRTQAEAQESALWQLKSAATSTTTSPSANHILQIRESFQNHNNPSTSLILEFCTHGSLADFIARSNFTPEPFAWHVLSSLASALCTCHYGISSPETSLQRPKGDWNALYHFKLAPKTVFLTSTYQQGPLPRVVLGGFTCVATKDDIESGVAERVIREHGGEDWWPPEVRRSMTLSKFADVWYVRNTTKQS